MTEKNSTNVQTSSQNKKKFPVLKTLMGLSAAVAITEISGCVYDDAKEREVFNNTNLTYVGKDKDLALFSKGGQDVDYYCMIRDSRMQVRLYNKEGLRKTGVEWRDLLDGGACFNAVNKEKTGFMTVRLIKGLINWVSGPEEGHTCIQRGHKPLVRVSDERSRAS